MNVWTLDSSKDYILENDEIVGDLMRQLRVPHLFDQMAEFDEIAAMVAFDNHPTHWIILRLWKGAPAYSPNHGISRFVESADPNGLLFQAVPKSTESREQMETRLTSESLKMGSKDVFTFQQLPE